MDDQFTLETPGLAAVPEVSAAQAAPAEVRLTGKSADGSRLLLQNEDGQRFELMIDERLMSMVARERKAAQAKAEPVRQAPPPREIQDRVRHGESVSQLAAAAGVNPAAIERFARTVLIERGHVADQAAQCLVRMGNDHRPLAEIIAEQVGSAASVAWDSWRCEDGSWTVQASFEGPNGTRSAEFSYNATEKSVRPVEAQLSSFGPMGNHCWAWAERKVHARSQHGTRRSLACFISRKIFGCLGCHEIIAWVGSRYRQYGRIPHTSAGPWPGWTG